ncbi:MAG: alpha/beta fold hydrolase [Bacteroidetes bacterium]|nr:alpha/beta fold hydrolase [Bacteroidota bacterium]
MLHFTVEGKGKTLVFLHGFLESSSMWTFLNINRLYAQNIFIDLPGHGNSALTDNSERPSIEFMAHEVLKVLNFLKIESYSIVGHSMGGYVGLLVKEMDSRCEKVVLINSNFWSDNEQKKKDRLRVAEIVFKAKKVFIREAIPNLFGNPENHSEEIDVLIDKASIIPPEYIAYSALAMRERKDFTNEVTENPTDYFIIHGKLDKLVETDFLTAQLKSSNQLFVLENAGHMAHIEQSEEVMAILKGVFS